MNSLQKIEATIMRLSETARLKEPLVSTYIKFG